MRALTIQKPHDLVMMEVEKPKNKNGHAMIKLETCGICGSDVTAYGGYNPTQKYPIQGIGHEGVGIIVEIEENEKGLKVGDRVALEPYVPDFTCPMCKVGRYNNCTNLKVRGVHIDGMMVDYIVHPLPLIHKIPADIDAVQAACVEPLSIALHGVARARVRAGEKVVIFGAGTIGIMAALSCLSYGAEPIIVDIIKSRLDFAGKVGIPHTFDSSNGGVVQYLQELTDGKLPDAMIECTGAAEILEEMHNYVCYGGRIALVGWAKNPVTINTIRCMQKEIDLCPSRNSANKFPEAIELILRGKIPTDQIITKVIGLEGTDEVIQDMIANPSDYLKIVVEI